jgi:choline dehydrogenase-like flavoprotein
VARIEVIRHELMRALFSPVFLDGTMRTMRIETTSEIARAAFMPPAYTHMVADANSDSGFAVVRDLLRALQRGRPSDALRLLRKVPKTVPELLELAFWRAAHRRLVMAKSAAWYLHVDFQQTPDVRNRIYLSEDRDADGCRRVRIEWRVFDDVAHWMSQMEPHLRLLWQQNDLGRAATLEFYEQTKKGVLDPANVHDIFHPAGTTRMALDQRAGCVDRNLLLFGSDNLFIASSSVFPSLGAANPTYTAMALGIRLADHLSRTS